MRSFIRTTVIGGVLFLIPLAVVVAVLGKAFEVLKVLATLLSRLIPIETVVGIAIVEILTVGIMLLCCFASGLLARSSAGRSAYEAVDAILLQLIPGYAWVRVYTGDISDEEAERGLRPVLVQFDDQYLLAVEAERTDDGLVAVYLPNAPNPRSGALSYVTADRVKPLAASFQAVSKVLKDLGRGSSALLAG